MKAVDNLSEKIFETLTHTNHIQKLTVMPVFDLIMIQFIIS